VKGKRIIVRIVAAILVALVMAAIAGYFVLRSSWFHQYLLTKIIERAREASGGQVEIEDYRFNWFTLTGEVRHLVIHGTEPNPDKPLFQADRLAVNLKIISFFRRRVTLNALSIEHPVCRLWIDAEGNSNIPQPRVPRQTAPINIFDLGVERVLIGRGELFYNDRLIPLDVELHELSAQIELNPIKTRYTGSLSYRDGRVQFGSLTALRHDVEVKFNGDRSGIVVEPIRLNAGSSWVSAHLKLDQYNDPVVDGDYQALVSTLDLTRILRDSSLPSAKIVLAGSLHYKNSADRPFLESFSSDGQFSSPVMTVGLREFRGQLSAVLGQYHLDKGDLDLKHLRANLLDGRLAANVAVRHLWKNPEFRVESSVDGLSLNAMKNVGPTGKLQSLPITGNVDGKTEATWNGAMQNLKVRSDLKIAAAVASTAANPQATQEVVPLQGVVHLAYDGRRRDLSLTQTSLQSQHTEIRLEGTLGDQSRLKVQARTDDLHEIHRLVSALGTADSGGPSGQSSELYGSASFNGELGGALKDFNIEGQLAASDLQFQGSRWHNARAGIHLTSSDITLRQGHLEGSAHSLVDFDAKVGLTDWAYKPSSPLAIKFSGTDLPMAELQRLARLQFPVTGILSAKVSFHGSQLNPVGEGSIQLTEARIWNEPVQNVALRFQGTGDQVHASMTLRSRPGVATGNLIYYPKNQGYEVHLDATRIKIDHIEALRSRDLPIRGVFTASANGRGTLAAPQLDARAEIPELQFGQERIRELKIQATLADHRTTVAIDSNVAGAFIQARGAIDLTSDYFTTATIDTRDVLLQALLARYLPGRAEALQGKLELHGTLTGPLKDPKRLEAHVQIPALSASYQSNQISNATPIQADYQNGLLTIRPAEIKGNGTSLQFQGTIPLNGAGPPILSARGTVDLNLLRLLDPEANSSGQLEVELKSLGDMAHPNVQGQARIISGVFMTPTIPLGLENVNGQFAIHNDRLEIEQLVGKAGGGDISAQGFLSYQPKTQFNLALKANNVRMRYPEGVRALLDGSLVVSGAPESARVNGQIQLKGLSLTREFDLTNFIGQFDREGSSSPGQGLMQNTDLDITLQSTDELNLVSSQLSLQGQANLRLRGTVATPVLMGRADISDGEVFFNKRRYHIERGRVDFVNPVKMEPVVNLQATTTVNQYNLSLNFVGPLDRLRTSYSSDPPLPPVDVINLLAFGESADPGTAPGRLGANSILAQGLASEVSTQIERFAGISSVKIDPLLGGDQRNPSARLAIQQRVTKDFIFSYSIDVSSTQRELIQLEYQINPRWSVSVTRTENGSIAIDGRLRKNF
jgi:translocation and assembly module TamB